MSEEQVDPVARVVSYLALLLQHIGGTATIPFAEIEAGLPAGHGVEMEQDPKTGDLTMTIKSKDDMNGQ